VGVHHLSPKEPECYKMLHRVSYRLGSCGHNNEPFGFMRGEEFLDLPSDIQLLKEDAATPLNYVPV
jgi:hypothetical protein